MNLSRLFDSYANWQTLLAALLAATSVTCWLIADRSDFAPAQANPENHEFRAVTPMLSARRIPKTVRAPISQDILTPQLQNLLDSFPDSTCLQVRNGGQVIEPQKVSAAGLIPASNQKLLTTYAALSELGENFRYRTEVVATSEPDDGVIAGDLFFIGSGDPFIVTADWLDQYESLDPNSSNSEVRSHTKLEDIADRIVEAGVIQVNGSVVGDESLFDKERYGPWDQRLVTQQQSGPLSALTVNEGYVSWPARFNGRFAERVPAESPATNAASLLTDLLRERGVIITGVATTGIAPTDSFQIAQVSSPLLSDTVTHINRYSSNLGAELLLKRLGIENSGEGTTEAGVIAVRSILAASGISVTDLVINDGSGLAETNRLSCVALADLLSRTGSGSALGRSMPVSGQPGTLELRFIDTPAEGLVRAKTGTLQSSRALSGFVESASLDGSQLTFSYVTNSPALTEQVAAVERSLVIALAEYPAGVPEQEISPAEAVKN